MSARKLPKKILMANLMAQAAAEASHDDEHRARFDKLIARIKAYLDAATDSDVIHRYHLDSDFSELIHIAKQYLRMKPEEFEAAVSVLNTPISRVVNTWPSGKDTRDVPDYRRVPQEFLRLPYTLTSPMGELEIIAGGAGRGYTATQIAHANKALRPLERARRAKIAEEDEVRAAARSAEIEAQFDELARRRREYEATNPPVPDYVIREREWLKQQKTPNNFIGVEVVFEDERIYPITAAEMERAKEAESAYLKTNAENMIREMERLTEHKFDRRWKTKSELHAALRDHFKFCGYDEELDFRWLRFGEYTAAARTHR